MCEATPVSEEKIYLITVKTVTRKAILKMQEKCAGFHFRPVFSINELNRAHFLN